MTKTCHKCRGSRGAYYCVNPDNGHLDTRINSLRNEWFPCLACAGSGVVADSEERSQ